MSDDLDGLVPGPLPPRADNYVTADPEPWVRPWNGERTAHTGVNLYGSGYQFKPRPEYDKPAEDLHEDAFRMTILVESKKIPRLAREGGKRGFHIHRDQDPSKRDLGLEREFPKAGPGEEWIVVCSGKTRPKGKE